MLTALNWQHQLISVRSILTMLYLLLLIGVLILAAIYLFMNTPRFGRYASGDRLQAIENSPNFSKGQFQNESFTPSLVEGTSMSTVMYDFFFKKSPVSKPPQILPGIKTDLKSLPPNENVMVWFGHSSYFMQVDGKKILVDPVFSGNASPLNFTTKSFKGSDLYTPGDMPEIDYLFITHDHWDHLDYRTISQLQPKIKYIITGLGVGAHLERWGFDPAIIKEKDWNEQLDLEAGFKVFTTPARHFSGRGFQRNKSLWMSFLLMTPSLKIYVGGDSGYDSHFKKIGDTFGPLDIAILECGQYNAYWKYIHMMPEEVVQAAKDLQAAAFVPIHWSKFTLALHAWDDPITRVTAEAARQQVNMKAGMIGEKIPLTPANNVNYWWTKL